MEARNGGHRVVVVSGASAGVGRAAAREFARHGYAVGLLARGEEGLAAAEREARDTGVPVLALSLDVSDPDAVREAADRIETSLGPVDVWVNTAFASVIAPFSEIDPEEFHRVTDVCYHGYVHGTRTALALMGPRGRGVVVQVGSALAYRGTPFQAAYCGAKHAVRGFTDSVRAELVDTGSGIRLTEVHLPAVNTPQFSWVRSRMGGRTRPVPPVYQPEVAARAIVWAAEHPRRRRYRVGASTVGTVLAQRLAPRVLDLWLGRAARRSQVRDEPAPRRDNLFEPVDDDRDFGARGEFDDESREVSVLDEVNRRRGRALLFGAAVCAAGTAGYALRRRTR